MSKKQRYNNETNRTYQTFQMFHEKLTSSVKMVCPVPAPGVDPYIVADICILVEGFNLDNKN